MTASTQRTVTVVVWILATVWLSAGLIAARQNKIAVSDARPLAAAIRLVENQLGVVITYEDASYLAGDDIEDVTDKVSRVPHPLRRSIVPRTTHFEFSYPSEASQSGSTIAGATVRAMLAAFGRSRPMASQFRLDDNNGVLHVVPVFVRTESKSLSAYESLLSTKITIPDQRDGFDALQSILDAVSKTTGRGLLMGSVPVGPLAKTQISLSRLTGTANDLISELLRQTAPRLSWQIFCTPGLEEDCYFNIHQVQSR